MDFLLDFAQCLAPVDIVTRIETRVCRAAFDLCNPRSFDVSSFLFVERSQQLFGDLNAFSGRKLKSVFKNANGLFGHREKDSIAAYFTVICGTDR